MQVKPVNGQDEQRRCWQPRPPLLVGNQGATVRSAAAPYYTKESKNTAGQKETPSARRRCVCYTKSAYCLGMYAVLGLCQVLGAMQDDAAANSSAIRRVFFKKEAVRLAVIINDDLFCATPLEMPPQDSSQLMAK